MPQSPEPIAPSDQALSEFTIFLEFDDLTSRYLNSQNISYHQVPEDEIADYVMEMFRRKAVLEALRLGTSWYLEMLEQARQRDWYVADRARLSRHVVLLALFPESQFSPNLGVRGPLTRSLLAERKAMTQDYPHLYDPRCWGVVPPEGIGDTNLREDLEELELEQSGLDENEFDTQVEQMIQLEMLFEKVSEVYPRYLEESLAIQKEIAKAFDEITGEGKEGREAIADLIESCHPGSISVLHRFIIDSLIFRFMLEEGMDAIEERAERWIGTEYPSDSPLRPITRKDAEGSLATLDKLFEDPVISWSRMMEASQTMADLGDASSSWNMTEAVLGNCEGTDIWSSLALQGVIHQLSSRNGRQEDLSRSILAKGEEGKDGPLMATGLMAMALSMHSLGRFEESEGYHERMMEAMLAGVDDTGVLCLYPIAAWACLERGARQDARRLSAVGLKAMAEYDDMDELREQLLDVRRKADKVERKRKDVPSKSKNGK